jgi:hypothetical protein
MCWSIGLYAGNSPLALRAEPSVSNPVLTAADVRDVTAGFVADPFLIRRDGAWHLFFEVYDCKREKGVIGLATSAGGLCWDYRGVVLEEPFHLSYPHVFADGASVWMSPETLGLGAVVLYRADPFPWRWRREVVLVEGRGADPTPFRHAGRWWLFVSLPFHGWKTLRLYHSEQLPGGWREHGESPIIADDPRRARPAGRVIDWEGRRLRFAQDCVPAYGTAVRAFEVLELTETTYAERPTVPEVVLAADDQRWSAGGVHHVDAHQIGPGRWLAVIDGMEPLS